ncbi:MAG TPA: hypothetical protein VFY25_05440 [Anaerolineales bacterium]|nr:hypothetical protein [Anaerolineales bacterium]
MATKTQRTLVLILVAVGAIIVGLYGLRTFRIWRELKEHAAPPGFPEMSEPIETDVELIRDWMTIPFIAKLYRVPPPVLYRALGISPRGNQDKSLTQLNEEYFPGAPGVVETKIKAAVLENLPPPLPTHAPLPAP